MTEASVGSSVGSDDRRVHPAACALEHLDREAGRAVDRCGKPADAARHASIKGTYLAAVRPRAVLATLRPTRPSPCMR
jgi:hypothetical protein